MEQAIAAIQAAVQRAERGDPAGAAADLAQAAAMAPDHLPVQATCGTLLRQLRHPNEALACFDRALLLQPDHPALLGNRGLTLAELGRFGDALGCIDRVAALRPDDADTLVNRASLLSRLGRAPEALAACDQAVARRPDHATSRAVRAGVLLKLKRYAEAIADCDHALRLLPGNAEALVIRGNARLGQLRAPEALADFDRALAPRPDHAETLVDRGNALIALDRPEDALLNYDQALRLDPANAHAWDHAANALRLLGRPSEALARHEHAATLAPEDAEVRNHLALCRLLLGDFPRGWREYESRRSLGAGQAERRLYAGASWLGRDDVRGKTVLLHAEQGLGDTIQFCRYAPMVAALGATVLLEVPPALRRLLFGLHGVNRVLTTDEPVPSYDFHCPLMSLPLALGTGLDTIPADIPYICPDPMGKLPATDRRRVGLAWSGNPAHTNDRNRSIPLARFVQVRAIDAEFHALQTDIRDTDQAALAGMIVPGPNEQDFADTAARIAGMDLVITVDTSVAHLAGAMGLPVWILLPFDPDWRWLVHRDDSPWYPSARLFRQSAPGDWDGVLDRVAAELARVFSSRFCQLHP